MINKILVPIDKITKTVNAISEKNLSGRLNIPETEDVRNNDGAGIGLSIVKWIVDIHKGSTEAKSVDGKKILFDIKLPINPDK